MRRYALEELVLGEILEEKAKTDRTRTFLKFREGELTYAEVNDMANRMAQGLAAAGVRQNHHVALMLPNCPELVYVVFALAKLGAVAVPINTAYKGDILHHVLTSSDSSMLIVDETLLDQAALAEKHLPNLGRVIVRSDGKNGNGFSGLQKPTMLLNDMLAAGRSAPRANVRFSDVQAIMYTSGTTGPSKGVIVPHAHALTDSIDSARYLAYTPDETIYCPLLLFHAAALWDGMMVALLMGASIAVVERFSASRFWSDVRHFDANVAMGIFSIIPILMNQPPKPDDKDHPLRALYLGQSAMDKEFNERFGVRSVESYTSTEIGIGTGSPYGEWKPGSCGTINDVRHEIKLVDDQDREVGEPGEIVVRSKQPHVILQGYYNFPKATADAFRNLWFHTGDLAYRDEDGYFYFLDRIKDSIRRRGENISAFEVERVINSHSSVLESAAFGVHSELSEDEVKVAVVMRPKEELTAVELAAYCEARLPSFMVPRYIEFVDELPRSAIGKIAKHELRKHGEGGITSRTWDRTKA